MSGIHILTQDKIQNTVNAVFHIPVPATLNEAGISWQVAVVMEAKGNITSTLHDIDPDELALLQSGALIEKVEIVRFSSVNLTNGQREQEVKDRYTTLSPELIAEKAITLAFMGYETEVV